MSTNGKYVAQILEPPTAWHSKDRQYQQDVGREVKYAAAAYGQRATGWEGGIASTLDPEPVGDLPSHDVTRATVDGQIGSRY